MQPHYSIFYSWQSDLAKETNFFAIRASLREAADQVEAELGETKIDIDEATRGAAGSPNIPQMIFSKIDVCDMFVSDLTTINSDTSDSRPVANPNVLVELGYAVATIGWERIILVFNKHYGNFPQDLPFDVDRHRATPFTITDKKDKAGKNDFANTLKDAIQVIIDKAPTKPAERKNISPEQRRREADIKNIKSALSLIHIQSFDYFLEDFPDRIPVNIFYFRDAFVDTVESNSFFLYDQKLLQLVTDFKMNWIKSTSYAKHYGPSHNSKYYKYHIPFDEFPNDDANKDFYYLAKHKSVLQKSFKDLLDYVRVNYLELDVDEMSENAFESYKANERGN